MPTIEQIRAAAAEHPTCGSTVYMDRNQCDYFSTDYVAAKAEATIAASTLLGSRDYDSEHRDLLKPLGSATVVLERQPAQGPGWFTITSVFPGR